MRKRKLYKGLAIAFAAILLATGNPAPLHNVAAKEAQMKQKATLKMDINDVTEEGSYTLKLTFNQEGSSEESMLGGFIDSKIKVTVQNGETWVTILSTKSADMLYDISLGDNDGNYVTSQKTGVGEKNSAGTYDMYEYTMKVNKLSDLTKMAVLVAPMGGQKDDVGKYEKYTKADIASSSIERGWTGFQTIIDKEGKPTGKEALNDALIDYGLDKNNDGTVTKEEVAQFKGDKMELTNCNLSNEGLELLKYLPESVTTLDLSYNNISELPSDLLMFMSQLENFYIEHNELKAIPKGFFKNNPNIDWIAADGNKITSLEDGTFEGLDNLTILDLTDNNISKISKDAFKGMPKIIQLGLYGNKLSTLEDGTLTPVAGSLKQLYLQENNFKSLPKAVEECTSLAELYAWENGMQDISKVDFSKLPNLTEVNLMHNEIKEIPSGAFAKNTNLDGLDLFDNQIASLTEDILPKAANLRKLDVRFNNMNVVDKKLIAKSQSFNRFYPQKSAMELKFEKTANNEMKWSQQLSALDLMYWYEVSNDAKKTEIPSADEYKEYLKEQGYEGRNLVDVLNENGYDWDIVTKIQKKDANGNYVTIKESLNEDKADEMNGTFNFTEDGTYRIAKDLYGYMGSMRNFLFEVVSNEVTIGNDDKQPNQPTTEKKQETTTTAEKKQTITTNKIVKPSRITKLKLKRSKKSVVLSWKKQKNATGYEIYRSTKKKGKYKKIATIKKVSKASYTNKKLKKGKTYYYKVRAYKTQSGKKVYGTFSVIKKVKIKK